MLNIVFFIEAEGYEDPRYWLEEGWAWRSENRIVTPEFWGEPVWNSPNHPVVGVSWYEAMAFVKWLTVQLDAPIRLPTEAEWEKAARGNDGRVYPWGDDSDPERANTQETGSGQTTPVGIYPAGASPYGCLDMSGNVWEWTSSLWVPYPYSLSDGRENLNAREKRVIRGGAWSFSPNQARTAFRGRVDPEMRNNLIGFRCLSVSADDEILQRAIMKIRRAGS